MKMLTFDKEIIRSYMEGSSTLQQGIKYYKLQNPGVSDLVAKESAIMFAQEKCFELWRYYDYIHSERDAYMNFANAVSRHEYFNTKEYDKIEADRKRKDEREKKRRNKLEKYCQENNLDFYEENKKQIIKLYERHKIFRMLDKCRFLSILGCVVFLVIAEQFIPNSEKLLIPFLIVCATLTLFFVIIAIIRRIVSPLLPDRVYNEAKRELKLEKEKKEK